MRYVVTGGAGFVGYHLCSALLSRGYSVVILDCMDEFYDSSLKAENARDLVAMGASFVRGDAGDARVCKAVMRGADGVFHLAGLAGVRESFFAPATYFRENAEVTATVCASAAHCGARAVVYASSSSVYGDAPTPLAEDADRLEPLSPYAKSKLCGELLVKAQSAAFGFGACVVRLFSVYGERMRPNLAARKFAGMMLRNEVIELYGECGRDYTYAKDAARGLALAMEYSLKNGGCEIFNIAGGRVVSTRELVRELERALFVKARTRDVGRMAGDAVNTHADMSKAKDVLGYCPRTSFEDGIDSFAGWLVG